MMPLAARMIWVSLVPRKTAAASIAGLWVQASRTNPSSGPKSLVGQLSPDQIITVCGRLLAVFVSGVQDVGALLGANSRTRQQRLLFPGLKALKLMRHSNHSVL